MRLVFAAVCAAAVSARAEADTFSKVFGKKPAEFQAEWDAYLRALK